MPETWLRRLIFQAYGFVLGVVAGKIHPLPGAQVRTAYIFFVALLALSLVGYARSRRRHFPVIAATLILGLAAFFLGWGRYSASSSAGDPAHISKFTSDSWKDRVSVEGVILTDPEVYADRVTFTLNPLRVRRPGRESDYEEVSGGRVEVTIRRTAKELYTDFARSEVYGWRIRVNAPLLAPPGEINPHGFSYREFLADRDIYGVQTVAADWGSPPPVETLDRGAGFFLKEWALALKEKILGVFVKTMPYPESAFLAGVTLGVDSVLQNVKCVVPGHDWLILDECRVAGVTHVLAVSGQHVTIIAGMFMAILGALQIPLRIQAPIVIVILFVFLILTGMPPSAMRATLMCSITLFFMALRQGTFRSSLMFGVAIAAMIVLFVNPKNITEASFTLSFAAILSLGLISEPVDRILSRLKGFARQSALSRLFIVAQGAILMGMMFPLSSYYFGRISVAGPFANVIAIPLTGVIVPLGLIAGLIGLIPGPGIFLALILNAANDLLVKIFFYTAHYSAAWFPYPFVENFTVGQLGVYYAALALFVWWDPVYSYGKEIYYKKYKHAGDTPQGRAARRAWAGVSIAAGALILLSAYHAWKRPPAVPAGIFRTTFLSIPYGTAAVLQSPGGRTYLIDGGLGNRQSHADAGEKIIAPFLLKQGIKTIDAVFLTNAGPEHTEGLATLLDGFDVKTFYDPVPIRDWNRFAALAASDSEKAYVQFLDDLGDPRLRHSARAPEVRQIYEGYATLAKIARRKKIPRKKIEAGTEIEEPPGGAGLALHLRVLGPVWGLTDYRDQSAVIDAEYGDFSVLFTGDAAETALASLLNGNDRPPQADILLIADHGQTASSHSPDWFRAFQPSAVVFQSGNFKLFYGKSREAKPLVDRAKEEYDAGVLYAQDRLGAERVFDTQRDFAVVIESDGKKYRVQSLNGKTL